MNFIVLFSREKNDEAVHDTSCPTAHWNQMDAEFEEADPDLKIHWLGNDTLSGEYINFVTMVESNEPNTKALSDRLQKAYDDYGVSGFFQITAIVSGMVQRVQTQPPAKPIHPPRWSWGVADNAALPHSWVACDGLNIFTFPVEMAEEAERISDERNAADKEA